MFGRARGKKTFKEHSADAVFHLSPDGYYILDDGVLTECNPSTERMLATKRDRLIGLRFEDLSPEKQACGTRSSELVKRILADVARDGVTRFEWTMKRLDGTTFPGFLTLIASQIDGRPTVITFLVDMTIMVELREQGDKARIAEEAAAKKQSDAFALLADVLVAGMLYRRRQRKEGSEGGSSRIKIPWFILFFIIAFLLRTLLGDPVSLFSTMADVARQALVVTLFLIGAGLSREQIRTVGPRPALLGILLWIVVASLTLGLIVGVM